MRFLSLANYAAIVLLMDIQQSVSANPAVFLPRDRLTTCKS